MRRILSILCALPVFRMAGAVAPALVLGADTGILLRAGFRNPVDLPLNCAGALFTHDSDMEFDIGSPWYPNRSHNIPEGTNTVVNLSRAPAHDLHEHLPAGQSGKSPAPERGER